MCYSDLVGADCMIYWCTDNPDIGKNVLLFQLVVWDFTVCITQVINHNQLASYKVRSPSLFPLAFVSILVMMQAGDLHPNPGPYKPKFPCVLCDKAAKWNQRAVSCDECQGWFHVDCMAMSTTVSLLKVAKLNGYAASVASPTFRALCFQTKVWNSPTVLRVC